MTKLNPLLKDFIMEIIAETVLPKIKEFHGKPIVENNILSAEFTLDNGISVYFTANIKDDIEKILEVSIGLPTDKSYRIIEKNGIKNTNELNILQENDINVDNIYTIIDEVIEKVTKNRKHSPDVSDLNEGKKSDEIKIKEILNHAKRKKDAEKFFYYSKIKNLKENVIFEKFKGTKAYNKWISENADSINKIKDKFNSLFAPLNEIKMISFPNPDAFENALKSINYSKASINYSDLTMVFLNESAYNSAKKDLEISNIPMKLKTILKTALTESAHVISKPVKDSATGEWIVKWMTNGKRDENKTYYTDDLKDAQDTAKEMSKHAEELNKKGINESVPPNFPPELKKKLLDRYKSNPAEAYSTMWKLNKKGVKIMKENSHKDTCMCDKCGISD